MLAQWKVYLNIGFTPHTRLKRRDSFPNLIPVNNAPGWRTGYPFIGPIRGCHRAGLPIAVLTNQRQQNNNIPPRAWAKGTDARSASPTHTPWCATQVYSHTATINIAI